MNVPSRLHELAGLGQSVWIDYLSRPLLRSGELARMIEEDAVTGVTSNPAIIASAIAGSELYDSQIRELLAAGTSPEEALVRLTVEDVREACDVLLPVHEASGGDDGFVSIEIGPELAQDARASFDEAARLNRLVDRPNVLVKIPATARSVPAIEDSLAAGRSINVTLVFSLERHWAVMGSYLRGLERLAATGGDVSSVRSFASFFVSRVDTETDRRLDRLGSDRAHALRGWLGVANARLAYSQWRRVFSSERWRALEARGARPQQCLWASTSVKDPAYRDVMYVESLIGPETVNTMPEDTIRAFQDHGRPAARLDEGADDARRLLDELTTVGIDYGDVVATLEDEAVRKFEQAAEGARQRVESVRSAADFANAA
jgi:transaldolase